VRKPIKEKKECYKRLYQDRCADNIEKYKVAKKTTKRAVGEAKGRAYEGLYQCLNTKDIYRMARARDRKTRDVMSIKMEAGRYKMVSETTLAVSRARVSQFRRHRVHGWCGPGVVTQHGTCAGTGHMDVAKRTFLVRRRWQEYFDKLFSGENENSTGRLDNSVDDTNTCFVHRFQVQEVREALKRMKVGKALVPNGIPIKVWRCLGD
jgi:hypothetical protein